MSKLRGLAAGLVVLAACLLLQGCIYTGVQRPLDTNYDQTMLGEKVGRASCCSILWLVAWGDGGTRAAAENGDISVINHADVQVKLFLFGAWMRITTVVYGD